MGHRLLRRGLGWVLVGSLILGSLSLGSGTAPAWAESVPAGYALGNGQLIFETQCAGCHIHGGNIIRRGKNLKLKTLERRHMDSIEAIAHIVRNGKMPMSAYQDTLTEQEILDVSAYVLDQAQQGWN
jgi:cytochrome c6